MATMLASLLVPYSLQLAAVVVALWALLRMFAPRAAAVRLRAWQGALVFAVFLPAVVFLPILPAPSNNGAALLSIASVSVEPVNGAAALTSWSSWLVTILIIGAALRATWIGLGWMKLQRRFSVASSDDDDSRFDQACRAVGVRARLVWRPDVSHPFTYGIASPIVVIPADLASAPDAAMRAIFTHELMHVRRRDWRSVVVEEAVRAILWFHPAVWLLLAELREAREEVIDRATVRLLGSRRSYLETLVALADRGDPLRLSSALPFFRSRQLPRRIAAIVSEVSMSRFQIVLASTAVFGASMITVGAAARAFPLPSISSSDSQQSTPAHPDAQSPVPGPIEQNAHSASADAPPPKRTRYVAPELPKETSGVHPEFTIRVVIDESGQVAESRLVSMKAWTIDRASANAAADAVMAAVRQWQFERPARSPLAMTVVLKVDSSDKGGNAPVIEQPIGIDVPSAEYPESARAKKIEGDVEIEATLDATGHVTGAKVVKSAASELDEAAIAAVRASVFRPGMRNGEPVPVTITMTMRFKLE